mmetsp:Transcript_17785/g.34776  ORF Transcript_17785/g.34776 Transcript_17785/m.34776 type:complete len:248 (-) Transcript_17785:594-1337(-)
MPSAAEPQAEGDQARAAGIADGRVRPWPERRTAGGEAAGRALQTLLDSRPPVVLPAEHPPQSRESGRQRHCRPNIRPPKPLPAQNALDFDVYHFSRVPQGFFDRRSAGAADEERWQGRDHCGTGSRPRQEGGPGAGEGCGDRAPGGTRQAAAGPHTRPRARGAGPAERDDPLQATGGRFGAAVRVSESRRWGVQDTVSQGPPGAGRMQSDAALDAAEDSRDVERAPRRREDSEAIPRGGAEAASSCA